MLFLTPALVINSYCSTVPEFLIMEESEASASSSAPKIKKPKINFSNVHHKFDTITIFNPKLDKEVTGSKCKVCQQTFMRKNSSTLKKHLEVLHPEIFKVVESKCFFFNFLLFVSDYLQIRS